MDRTLAAGQVGRVGQQVPALLRLDPAAASAAERAENFPVASRLLSGPLSQDLRAVYDVARAIDNLGDDASGDRLALLDDFEADLRRAWAAQPPNAEILRRLAVTVRRRDLGLQPFLNLVEANRLDQRAATYPTWRDLKHYCTLSADPIGRIVLELFGASRPDRVALSDNVCTALQVLEHCQDIAEDRGRGRTYLPLDDLAAHGVALADLDAPVASPQVRALVGWEVARAERLLGSGRELVRGLRGFARLAVAGYIAGGLATADALRRAGFDSLAATPKPARRDVLRHSAALVAGRA